MNETSLILCVDGEPNFLKYFDLTLAPELLYYSYVPIVILSLSIGIFILFKNNFSVISKALFLLTSSFSFFIINELVQWAVIPAGMMYFAYSFSLLLQLLILISTIWFVYLFIEKKSFEFYEKTLLAAISLPIIVLLPTNLNLEGVDLNSCSGITGPLWLYSYCLQGLVIIIFLVWAMVLYKRYKAQHNKEFLTSFYLLLGTSIFLAIFFSSYLIGDLTWTFEINLLGPLGMLIFIGTLSYLIVRFHTFNIRMIGAQALVASLWFLVGSLLFVAVSDTTRIIAGVTLVFTTIAGYFLVRSVEKEVKQKEEIARLAESLKIANERLKILDKMKSEFVSIASHQLRSPLTSIRGYASMLSEGSYGKLPAKVQEVAEKISDSAKYMALSVEDYLNVSRIEAGNMKYEYSDFNLKEVAERLVDELRPVAVKKGLAMMFRSDCSGSCMVHADIGKTRQVLMNLIDNSMKYTPKGTITVVAHDDVKMKKMYVTIQDTGVGMSPDTLEEVFDKFVRAKNANSVNVTGTGLGLFVAKKMITQMGGRVWAESEGEGKGSTFHVELPLLPGKSGR